MKQQINGQYTINNSIKTLPNTSSLIQCNMMVLMEYTNVLMEHKSICTL